MTIQQFVEKAIKGGWKPKGTLYKEDFMDAHILDPEMWKAVGKVEGWTEEWIVAYCLASQEVRGEDALRISKAEYNMHRMIDALFRGKTTDEFLETLTQPTVENKG